MESLERFLKLMATSNPFDKMEGSIHWEKFQVMLIIHLHLGMEDAQNVTEFFLTQSNNFQSILLEEISKFLPDSDSSVVLIPDDDFPTTRE
jgi:hypothetical protein